ncbi:MAG TPA: Crp/Fnr family transcriptional regulator [Xanthobacteraceae bacterium]
MAQKIKSRFDPKVFLATPDGSRAVAHHRKDQTIFSQADPADAIFYIQKGKVKIVVTSKLGKQAVVAIHDAGEFFGEGCLIAQKVRLANAVAMTDCTLTRIAKAEMLRYLRTEPDLAEMFTAHMLTRNSRVEADLVDLLFNSSEKRLARTLLLLAHFGKDGQAEPITTKITQETLADMVGTTRSRISFFMNKFRKLGFIEYNGDIKVNNSLLSVLLHD